MLVLTYSDYYDNMSDMTDLCKNNKVVFDFKLFDIPNTMRRNIRTLAELGGYAVTIADDPYNSMGINEAYRAGEEYGIKTIIGEVDQIMEPIKIENLEDVQFIVGCLISLELSDSKYKDMTVEGGYYEALNNLFLRDTTSTVIEERMEKNEKSISNFINAWMNRKC